MSDNLGKVTRRDLADAVVKTTGVPRAEALKVMDATFNLIAEALDQGRIVNIRGFGAFDMRETPARTRVDRSGATVEVPAGRRARLKLATARPVKDAAE
ncbi:HU family DNA-binding protein [Methylopila henanensis]|uniref:HU family DNA-binding protein n=1 Tax=Methylopila henanensis TaxID=873516 RepID=A0ABW4K8X8_9HYPH